MSAWINAAEFCAEFDHERLERSSAPIARIFDRPRTSRAPSEAEQRDARREQETADRRQYARHSERRQKPRKPAKARVSVTTA